MIFFNARASCSEAFDSFVDIFLCIYETRDFDLAGTTHLVLMFLLSYPLEYHNAHASHKLETLARTVALGQSRRP